VRRWLVFVSVVVLLVLYTGLELGFLVPKAPLAAIWSVDVAFFWLLIGWQLAQRRGASARSRAWAAFGWVAAFATGLWATFVLLTLPVDLAALARSAAPPRALMLGVLAVSALLAALGLRQALAGPVVREVSVPISGLPEALAGLRIVQVSDLHVGPMIAKDYVGAVVDDVLSLEPDLVALTGDIADGAVEHLAAHVAPLARLRAPLGVYYVTGNHEYYWGAEPWVRKMKELGLTPLIGEGKIVEKDGARLLVGGIPDPAALSFVPAHRGDASEVAAAGEADFKLLLAHRPDAYEQSEPAGFDLQLSGHTHGGQFFPFSVIVGLAHRYRRGLHKHGRLWLYVNSGTGYWGPPHRFAVPAEITLLVLRPA